MYKITLGLNTAKFTDYIEKRFKLKLLKIKFPTKIQCRHMSISPRRRVFTVIYLSVISQSQF